MKILVVCIPQAGHTTPLLPLVRALCIGGDDVVVATGEDVRSDVERAGARFAMAGRGMHAWFAELASRTRGAPGDGLPPERIPHYFTPRLFAEIATADMIDGVLSAAEQQQPEVVIFDTEAFAGPLVAAVSGALAVHHTIGPPLPPDVLELCSDALSPLWRSFGLDRPAHGGLCDGLTVSISPPSFGGGGAGPEVLPLRPAPLPELDPEPQSPPLVYVTFGTVWASADVVRIVLAALARSDLQVLVTLGGLDPAAVGEVPPNVRLESFVPQQEVLPRCSLSVNHAGAGTMLGALAHGLPQVLLPQAADNFLNAAVCQRAGAAEVLLPGEVTAETVAAAVHRVMGEPAYRQAAQHLAAEIADMPEPAAVAGRIREAAGRRARVPRRER